MKNNKSTVLIADDHALMRVGLKTMLNALADLEVIAEAEDGLQAVNLAQKLKPDVIVMDLMMPMLNGAEATRQIRDSIPNSHILILTSYGASADLQRAIMYGATGVQMKEQSTRDIVSAIRAVAKGQKIIPSEVIQMCKETPPPRELTDRQVEILRAVTNGLSNKQIANRYNLSQAGVKKHLSLIFHKLGVTSRTEAIAAVFKKHLLKI